MQDLHLAPFSIMDLFDDVNDKLFAFEKKNPGKPRLARPMP